MYSNTSNHFMTKRSVQPCLLVVTLLLLITPLMGQADSLDQFHSIFKELKRDSILAFTLETDFKKLVKKKYEEKYQPVTLKFLNESDQPMTYEAKIRTRGNIRKKVCYYPPLKLKFKKQWLTDQGMDSVFNDLKLVIGCKKGDFYGGLVLKEFLAYQLYAELTDYHFRTQLVDVTIHDTGDKWKPYVTKAFLIENQDEMAFRFNGRCTKPRVMRSKSIWEDQLALMTLFNYMIGNTDWAFANSHNVRFVRSREKLSVIPIAYDFDYAGMVNAPYAVHRESIGIEDIKERYFLGNCKHKAAFEKVMPRFLEKKARFYEIVNGFEEMSAKDRKQTISYFDDFFEILENPKAFKKRILESCVN